MLMQPRCLLLLALLAVAGCGGGGGGDGEGASPATTPTPTTTTVLTTTSTTVEVVDPYAVPEDPADIDEAYVEAVINEHNRVIGDALRIQLEGGDPAEIVARYNAIYVPEVADLLLTDALNETGDDFLSYRLPPGDVTVRVTGLPAKTTQCVVASVVQDNSAMLVDPPRPVEGVVVLRKATVTDAGTDLNGTMWLSEGLEPVASDVGQRCAV